jgi:hypothetical protein
MLCMVVTISIGLNIGAANISVVRHVSNADTLTDDGGWTSQCSAKSERCEAGAAYVDNRGPDGVGASHHHHFSPNVAMAPVLDAVGPRLGLPSTRHASALNPLYAQPSNSIYQPPQYLTLV